MIGEATSPAVARWLPSEWRAFGAFLRRPVLPEHVTGIRAAAIAATLKLFALDLLLMIPMLGAIQIAVALGVHIPNNEVEALELTPRNILLVIAVAPVLEEIAFRSWLSGRAGHVVAVLALIVGIAVPVISGPQAHPILLAGSLLIAAFLAIVVAIWLRKRPAMPFFARHFAWFYFASALLFAATHVTNYAQGFSIILVPLVVPQLTVGLIFGFARVNYGLWSDILLHMMHNGLLIALVALQKGM